MRRDNLSLAPAGPVSSGRRGFLQAGGALVVAFSLPLLPEETRAAGAQPFAPVPPQQLDSWIAVAQDGTVSAYTGRIDMGTGVETVFTQAVADELDVPFDAVHFTLGDTAHTPEQGKSTASNNIARNLPPLRQAAAEARLALLDLAAARFGVPAASLSVKDGVVAAADGRSVHYGELIGGKRFDIKLETKGEGNSLKLGGRAKPKDPKQFRILGKPMPRVDIPAKVRGQFRYVHDVVVDGMAYGTVVLPPGRGMKLVSVDGFSQPVAGVVKVVSRGNFVGIVAETEQAAVRARTALKVTWAQAVDVDFDDMYGLIARKAVVKDVVEGEQGDIQSGFAKAAHVVEGTYYLPDNSHGMMGPSCAVADFRDGNLTIWSGTQWPDGTRRDTAAMLGIPVENVRVVWVPSAGSYGRLGVDDAAADAALLSQAAGRPVRLQWQRADEHEWAPVCPAAVIETRAGIDKDGTLVAWQFESRTSPHSTSERGNMLAWRALGTNPGHKRLSGGADTPGYGIPNLRVVTHYTEETLRAIYMRSVAGIQNTFAIESMMDDLAAKAGIDPVEFRLRHTPSERARHVIETVAKAAAWDPKQKPVVKGDLVECRGIAAMCPGDSSLSNHGAWGNLATIVDVVLDKRTGMVRVKRAYVAFDAGRIGNPDGLRAQAEGGTIMGISRTLKEQVLYKGAGVASSDWLTYPVLQFSEMPEAIDVTLIESDRPPLGAGEVPNVTPPGAIGNAIFAATGVRLRSLPLTPDKVRAALASA